MIDFVAKGTTHIGPRDVEDPSTLIINILSFIKC